MTAPLDPQVAAEVLEHPLGAGSLLDAIRDLQRDVLATQLPIDLPEVGRARAARERMARQLADHLLPRLTQLATPVIVVVAGSTGAGKSTLVNSLLGSEVSRAGALRPTTRRPVLAQHPADAELLAGHPLLADVDAVVHEGVPRGLALLDAPDLDSVVDTNRAAARRLLDAADLWVLVTTATRYGDAVPWQVLRDAVARGASAAMVLNRVPPEALTTVRADLLDRLRGGGMADVPLFVIGEAESADPLLPAGATAPVMRWLTMVAGSDRARTVVRRTLRGSFEALRPELDRLAEAVQAQVDAARELRDLLTRAAAGAAEQASADVLSGRLADGAVRARWTEIVAGGPVDVVRRGRVRGGRRSAARWTQAARPVMEDLRRAAEDALRGTAVRAEEVLRTLLTAENAPEGAGWLARTWPGGPVGDVPTEVDAWLLGAGPAIRVGVDEVDHVRVAAEHRHERRRAARERRRAARAERAVGRQGLAAITLSAAGGVTQARELLGALLGTAGEHALRAVQEDLASRVEAQVMRVRDGALAVLDQPALADDAAAALRLRLAVLKDLT